MGIDMVPSSEQLESGKAYDRRRTADRSIHKTFPYAGVLEMNVDKVPSSGQLESEKAHDRRDTADRPNHKTFLDAGVKSERL
ncbi:hypothetical protein HAX54_047577, partial [Datura stramonium]|nr:hypothetical protein [Datura stramonium]